MGQSVTITITICHCIAPLTTLDSGIYFYFILRVTLSFALRSTFSILTLTLTLIARRFLGLKQEIKTDGSGALVVVRKVNIFNLFVIVANPSNHHIYDIPRYDCLVYFYMADTLRYISFKYVCVQCNNWMEYPPYKDHNLAIVYVGFYSFQKWKEITVGNDLRCLRRRLRKENNKIKTQAVRWFFSVFIH